LEQCFRQQGERFGNATSIQNWTTRHQHPYPLERSSARSGKTTENQHAVCPTRRMEQSLPARTEKTTGTAGILAVVLGERNLTVCRSVSSSRSDSLLGTCFRWRRNVQDAPIFLRFDERLTLICFRQQHIILGRNNAIIRLFLLNRTLRKYQYCRDHSSKSPSNKNTSWCCGYRPPIVSKNRAYLPSTVADGCAPPRSASARQAPSCRLQRSHAWAPFKVGYTKKPSAKWINCLAGSRFRPLGEPKLRVFTANALDASETVFELQGNLHVLGGT